MSANHRFTVEEIEGPSKIKKLLLVLGLLLLLITISGFSYYLGTKNAKNQTPSIAENFQTPFPTNEGEQAPSPSPSGSPTPTKRGQKAPTPTPTPPSKMKVILSTASRDGFRSSNGAGNASLEIRVGRNEDFVTRGFLSFDLSELPSEINMQKATLRIYQAKITGSPYNAGNRLKLDHLTFGDILDSADYSLPALYSNFKSLTISSTISWKEADVTSEVKNDQANARSRSDFRIHFETENTGGDDKGDFVYFEASENTLKTGNTPQLVIVY
ncbi:hypothetical protein A3A75_02070 [Candidatus Woesebacteria bacterium RIFCSPLOWO2_01_FULL_39_10]|uniref:Carbohydrate-binding module family 96 domain-containing protein n=1 Tax=Candidatus Woesebacteria bacterium RIFCSPLOWO2_01_FULL_39_10 TaxID=1802516 RepID=A0A1F8B6U4_9BACT|nr:MAG: hypothetical protein A3A75_02070 [Candidatus Woesebacteria bacterium RIFCSPLOWO2_01_FULL_39_10]